MQTNYAWVGIAKSENDKNDYYIKVSFDENIEVEESKGVSVDTSIKALEDLSKATAKDFKDAWEGVKANYTTGGCAIANKIEIFTDKDGNNCVFIINVTEDTPILAQLQADDDSQYNYTPEENKGTDEGKYSTEGKLAFVPEDYVEVTDRADTSADVTVHGAIRCWSHDDSNGACAGCGYSAQTNNLTTTSYTAPDTPTDTDTPRTLTPHGH